MYSSAFNNFESLAGAADSKTGTFSFRHTFGTVQADGRFGPKCNLTMSYSMLATLNTKNETGLGRGWSLRLGSYSRSSKLLTLNSGTTYMVLTASHSGPWKLSHKLKGIRVEEQDTEHGTEIHIYHKNGDEEIMEIDSYSGDASLSRFISANGRYLQFSYQKYSGVDRLVSIQDTNHTLLAEMTYDDNNGKVVVVTHPGTPDETTTTLSINQNGLLNKIKQPDGDSINFEYSPHYFPAGGERKFLYPLKRVEYSTGASEEMEYKEELYLPLNAPIPYMPAISKHVKTVATNQPPIVTTFEYEKDGNQPGKNYWGYKSGITWEDNTDDLFNYPSQYRYSSTESCGDKITKCEYNKFHQIVSKTETNGNESHKIVTCYEYYCDEREVLENQPIKYELLKKEIVHFEQSSSEVSQGFTKSYEYDEWGNVTTETDTSGVRTTYVYFPVEGGEGCPAHPFGMEAFVKEKSHYPTDESPIKKFRFTYQSISRVGGGTTVVPLTESYGNKIKSHTYFDSSDSRVQGVPKSQTLTIGSKATTRSCNYEFNGDTMCVTDTITGYDGMSSSSSKTLSYWTGLTKSETDEASIVSVYTHDKVGRLLSQTTGAGTEYEILTTFNYVDHPVDPSSNAECIGTRVVQETTSGATTHTYYDGENRVLAVYQKDNHGELRKVSEKRYDNQGRKVFESELDYIISESGSEIEKTMREEASYVYDSWGEKSETHHDDGTIDIVVRDPVHLKAIQQVVCKDHAGNVTDKLSSTETTQDLFGNPTIRKVFTKTGELYSTTSISYDGFGRKRSVISPVGHEAKITEYDEFDRPVEFQHYDGTVVKVSYADFTTENLISHISVPSMESTLGEQTYDGLSRVTCKTVCGVKTHFTYKKGFDQPSRLINARGQTTLFDYIPELEMQTARVASFDDTVLLGAWDATSKTSDAVFAYGKKSDANTALGRIVSASSGTSNYTYQYSKSGDVKTATQTVGTQSQTITNERMTMEGKPLTVAIGERNISYEYNELGQVVSITDGDMKIEMDIDSFGRVSTQQVKQFDPISRSYGLSQSTDTTYDEFNRETHRVISVIQTRCTISIMSEYDDEDKLVKRITTVNEVDSMTESFTYDSKRRLLKYNATNSTTDTLLPCNENGRPFQSQSFTFDGLDNITSIVTVFPNGDTDTAIFAYDNTRKQMLTQITHTLTTGENVYPPSLTLQYDDDGNLVSYKDCKMTYTPSGRLSTRNNVTYIYDAFDRLIQSNETVHMYSGKHIVREIDGTNITDFVRCNDIPIGEVQNGQKKIYGVDQKLSVVALTADTTTTFTNYSPYGSGNNGARIGFNGELRDKADHGVYHLGNGTRTYLPAFNGFSSIDSFSPFLGGGINPYRYCGANPINAIDPSGHIFKLLKAIFWGIASVASLIAVPFTGGSSLAITLGVLGGVTGVVSSAMEIGAEVATEMGNEKLAAKFGKYSFGFGIASTVLSLGTIGTGIAESVTHGMRAKTAQKLSGGKIWSKFSATDDIDAINTTGYRKKLSLSLRKKNMYVVAEEDKSFFLFKKGSLQTSVMKQRIKVRRFGPLRISKIKEPIRVLRGGKYAGALKTVKMNELQFTKLDILSHVVTGRGVYSFASSFGADEEDTEGSEPTVNRSVQSAFGLPVATETIGAEKMLFRF